MSLDDPTQTSPPGIRGEACVVIAVDDGDEHLRDCLESVRTHTPADVPIITVPPTAAGVNRALEQLWPADIVLLSEPCRVTASWLVRMREAALADTNTASASALVDAGTALALSDENGAAKRTAQDLAELARAVAQHTLALRPRLNAIVGPCVYLRRDALELVGELDAELELRWALEVDLAQRCLLAGLAHVAADDVVVRRLASARDTAGQQPAELCERYPYLHALAQRTSGEDPPPLEQASIAASGVLPRALEAARRPRSRLWVTIDARSLTATLTGTQRHILELVRALAATGHLRLRLVVSDDTSAANVELLRSLPQTELLPIGSIDERTPRSTIFHRPQQIFGPPDLRLAQRLGERLVLNQLDLIAYRNPGYHANATAWRSHRRVSRQALAAADRVVVFSNHTRVELLTDELADGERIRIVPPGLDHPSPGGGRPPVGLERPSHPPPGEGRNAAGFLLCLGTDFRHKNRVFALRLLAALRERHGWQGRLVLAGTHISNGSSLELERDFLERRPQLQGAVVELGAVEEEEKVWLMAHADAVVYPSVYEGFGLVPFEAGLSGVPCVFAPQSSLAEVLPAEATAIVPWSPDESAAAVCALLTDPAKRARHVQALLQAARRLTWAGAAETTVEVYHEAAVAPTREASALSSDEVEREVELHELIAAHDALVVRLVDEREHAQRMYEHAQRAYDELNTEVGYSLSLIGPHGTLPEDVQRALLALSARPALSQRLYGVIARAFRVARAVGRAGRRRPAGERTDLDS
jgi:alpha-1,3-rhamnosyl/mannosyltransferase